MKSAPTDQKLLLKETYMLKRHSSKTRLTRISAAICAFTVVAAVPCSNFYRPVLPVAAESSELPQQPFPFLRYYLERQDWNDQYYAVIEKCDADYVGNLVIPEYIEGAKVIEIRPNAFDGCMNLTGIDIPETVDIIGNRAFADCFSLKSVIIRNDRCMLPDSDDVFSSDMYFYGDDKFAGTIFAASGSTADEYAQRFGLEFSTDIPELADSPASALPYLDYDVESSFVIIKKCDPSASGRLMIPRYIEDKLVIEISEEAFKDCTGIVEIELPDTIRHIAPETFAGCSGMRKIDLPESVRFVEQNAFNNCASLETVIVRSSECEIYSSPETICNTSDPDEYTRNLFFGTIYAPAGSPAEEYANYFAYEFNTEIPEDPVYGENALPYLSYEDIGDYGVRITKCSPDASGKLIVPCKIDGRYVVSIAEEAFMDCKNITEIELPMSLVEIEPRTFIGCTGLKKIDLGRAIRMIGSMAFFHCPSLKTVIIRNGECLIDQGFETFSGLGEPFTAIIYAPADSTAQEYAERNGFEFSTEMPDQTRFAVDNASCLTFENGKYGAVLTKCDPSAVGKLVIPEIFNGQPVEMIDKNAFDGCSDLTSVTLPRPVRFLSEFMFEQCDSLCEVIIPEHTIEIQNSAFSRCVSLQKLELPESIEHIGANAFDDCMSLEEIKIPEQVRSINNGTFNGCESLKKVDLPENITEISVCAFSNCRSLESIKLPENLKTLGYGAFEYCTNLKTVEIPAGLDKIEEAVFERSGVSSIVIPDNIRTVSRFSFNCCENLEKITILNPYCYIHDSGETICSSSNRTDGVVFNGIICGYDGSTAEKYAKKYGYSFESLGEMPEGVRGDANADEKLTVADAVMLEKWLLGSGKLTAPENVDLCRDGTIDTYDMCLLRKELIAVNAK